MSAALELTPSQARAVQAREINVAVVAGAGAGKTRVLVDRYLELLARGVPLKKIVAITFTEKAASEMRERVRREIETRALQTDAPAFWHDHRRDMDDARISTIHSLCTRLLRANPVEARLDPRFGVLDEQDAALWQQEALDAVFKTLAERGGAELALFDEYRLNDVRDTLTQLLGDSATADDAFARMPDTVEQIMTRWRTQLTDAQANALQKLSASAEWQSAAHWVQNNAASDAQDKIEQTRAAAESALEMFQSDDIARALTSLRALCDLKMVGGSKKNWDDLTEAKAQLTALRNRAREFCKHYDLEFTEADERAARFVLLWRALWQRARAAYAERKERERVLDFNDLEEKTRALLTHHDAVRQRYRDEFATVLVDEFQDTNGAQRDIVYALAPPDLPNRLFVVGDGKQSIYGFRGADVTVFETTQQDVVARWGKDARVVLEESFRAHTRLAQAFNFLFENIFATDGPRALYEVQYETLRVVRASLEREPQLELIEFPKELAHQDEIQKLNAQDTREWQAREIAVRLMQLVAQEFQVWDKTARAYRPARWGDMALLCRRSTIFPIFEDALKAAQIPYLTFAGKGYYDRPEVRDLLNYLRALENPLDDLALAVVLHSPLFALSSETLYRLRRDDKHFYETLRAIPADVPDAERARVEIAHAILENGWARVGRTAILDLLHDVLNATAYLATLSALNDGDRRRGNVEKLLALARRTRAARVGDFNQYIRDLTTQETREGEALLEADNAVRLMTIHAAKGLEFPIVVLPDASAVTRSRSEWLLVERDAGAALKVLGADHKPAKTAAYELLKRESDLRDDAESKRLLYVALTRAQDYVIVTGEADAADKSDLGRIKNALRENSAFDWGRVEMRAPQLLFDEIPAPFESKKIETQDVPLQNIPALAHPLHAPAAQALTSFSATGLETLRAPSEIFARHVLEGAPDRIPIVTKQTKTGYVPQYIIGDVTHRALRQWRFPHNTTNLENVLESYARELGLADEAMLKQCVTQARGLLTRFIKSELFRAMNTARVREHEVPFVCEWRGRMVHGSMDVLVQTADGAWFIADFKTDDVRDENLRAHVLEHYAVQLGLYQYAAAQALNENVPVRVHYVRRGETIELRAEDVQEVLAETAQKLRA